MWRKWSVPGKQAGCLNCKSMEVKIHKLQDKNTVLASDLAGEKRHCQEVEDQLVQIRQEYVELSEKYVDTMFRLRQLVDRWGWSVEEDDERPSISGGLAEDSRDQLP